MHTAHARICDSRKFSCMWKFVKVHQTADPKNFFIISPHHHHDLHLVFVVHISSYAALMLSMPFFPSREYVFIIFPPFLNLTRQCIWIAYSNVFFIFLFFFTPLHQTWMEQCCSFHGLTISFISSIQQKKIRCWPLHSYA